MRLEDTVRRAGLVLLAVPDREIERVARTLISVIPEGWTHRTVLHHSGALGLAPLRAVSASGAGIGVMHPLQVLGRSEIARALLAGSRARIEGNPKGRAAARRLAADLGLVPIRFRRELTVRDRVAYHAAASMASNDLVALLSIGSELLGSTGLGSEEALEALLPLARGTLLQVQEAGLPGALTGPVARGDAATLTAQLRHITRVSREVGQVHRLLSRRLLRLALGTGALRPKDREALKAILLSP